MDLSALTNLVVHVLLQALELALLLGGLAPEVVVSVALDLTLGEDVVEELGDGDRGGRGLPAAPLLAAPLPPVFFFFFFFFFLAAAEASPSAPSTTSSTSSPSSSPTFSLLSNSAAAVSAGSSVGAMVARSNGDEGCGVRDARAMSIARRVATVEIAP